MNILNFKFILLIKFLVATLQKSCFKVLSRCSRISSNHCTISLKKKDTVSNQNIILLLLFDEYYLLANTCLHSICRLA